MVNKERTRISHKQMPIPWQKGLDKDKDSNREACGLVAETKKERVSNADNYARLRPAQQYRRNFCE